MGMMTPCFCGDIIDLLSTAKRRDKAVDQVIVTMGNGTYHTLNKCGWIKDMKSE